MKISLFNAAALLGAAMLVFACKPENLNDVNTDATILPGAKVNVNTNASADLGFATNKGTARDADKNLYVKSEEKTLTEVLSDSELESENGAVLKSDLSIAPDKALPEVLEESTDYAFVNPCVKVEIENPADFDVMYDSNLQTEVTKAGAKSLKLPTITIPAKTRLVLFVSAKGGLAKRTGEMDVVLPAITDGYKPMPSVIKVTDMIFRKIIKKSGMKAAEDKTYEFTVSACNFTPLVVMPGSKLLLSYKATDLFKFDDVNDASTHFTAEGSITNKMAFDIEASADSQVNDAYATVDNVIKAKATTDFKGDLYTPGGLIQAKDMVLHFIFTAVEETAFDPQKDQLIVNITSITYPEGVNISLNK
ncbi:MAG: hypothetical protein J5871_04420 [Bacteroidales bacterium]|nr:hypothetical protein [Bacteroidales bacterium]